MTTAAKFTSINIGAVNNPKKEHVWLQGTPSDIVKALKQAGLDVRTERPKAAKKEKAAKKATKTRKATAPKAKKVEERELVNA